MAETADTNQDAHAKAKRGIKLLMGRQVVLQLLTFAGGVVLARKLGPGPFGLYVIANFLVGTFALLGDFGLAPSFIQRKADLTDRDLQVGFTLQQILTTSMVIVLWAAAPWLAHFYPKAPPETAWLVRSLAFNLFLTSWRSMSALQLERHMKYDKLARIEMLEALIYQGTAVCLAVTGHGAWSFICAVLASGFIGTTLVYAASPWPIRFAFDRQIAAEILRFGIPFQLQTISNSIGGWVSPILVGHFISPQGVGFLTWASSNGKKPLILVDNVMRVAFPHFSRIQNNRPEVERVLIRYLTLLLLASGLWFVVLLVTSGPLVMLIYTEKWMPAVPALIVCAATTGFDVIMWVTGLTLNSLGMVNFTTKIVLIRSVICLGCSIPLVIKFGFIGIPVASFVGMLITTPWLFGGLGKDAFRRLSLSLLWLIIPTLVATVVGKEFSRLCLPGVWFILGTILVAIVVYAGTTWCMGPRWLKHEIVSLKYKLKLPSNVIALKSRVEA